MKREAEWFGEFTGEAEHEPDALFGKPGCLFGVNRLRKLSWPLLAYHQSHMSMCLSYASSVRSSRSGAAFYWCLSQHLAEGSGAQQALKRHCVMKAVVSNPARQEDGWRKTKPRIPRLYSRPHLQSLGDKAWDSSVWRRLLVDSEASRPLLTALWPKVWKPVTWPMLLLRKIIRPVRNQATLRRSRRTRVYFTPADPDELTLEILGPG